MKQLPAIFFMRLLGFTMCMAAAISNEMKGQNIDYDSIPNTLQEIVVNAPYIRREADRIVVNVGANPTAANKDAQELLKTAPGVWVSDESLSIFGQGGTTVYIDDRKVNLSGIRLMNYLKSIQGSTIAAIEIIPKAGTEYSADSSGGIIRINLKRNRVDGLIGSVGLNGGGGGYNQWLNPFANVSVHKDKWTVNLNGNGIGTFSDRNIAYDETNNPNLSQLLKGVTDHDVKGISGNLMTGVFYEPTSRDKFGLQLEYSPDRRRKVSNSRTGIFDMSTSDIDGGRNIGMMDYDRIGETSGKYERNNRDHNFYAAFNWSHITDDKGSELKLISNYNYQRSSLEENDSMRELYQALDSIYSTDNMNLYNIFVTDLSFRKVFNKDWSLNLGIKYTLNSVSNSSFHRYLDEGTEAWIANDRYDFDNRYDEHILAVFAATNGKVGRWRLKAGIRGEYYVPSDGIMAESRCDIFPNVNVAFNLTEKGDYTVALGYYRNIRRPSFQSLNPVVRQVSDYTYNKGNPSLRPSFTDAISLDFVLASRFTVAAGYSLGIDPIRQMFASDPKEPERLYLTWGNEGWERTGFVHGDGMMNVTGWWNLYLSATYVMARQKLSYRYSPENYSYLQMVASTTFMLPKDFNLTVNCFYNSKMKIGNITVYPILNVNPTLQKQFGKHWSVSLGVENMLERWSRTRTESNGYRRVGESKSHVTAKVGLTYKFNSGKGFKSKKIEKNMDRGRLAEE